MTTNLTLTLTLALILTFDELGSEGATVEEIDAGLSLEGFTTSTGKSISKLVSQ